MLRGRGRSGGRDRGIGRGVMKGVGEGDRVKNLEKGGDRTEWRKEHDRTRGEKRGR